MQTSRVFLANQIHWQHFCCYCCSFLLLHRLMYALSFLLRLKSSENIQEKCVLWHCISVSVGQLRWVFTSFAKPKNKQTDHAPKHRTPFPLFLFSYRKEYNNNMWNVQRSLFVRLLLVNNQMAAVLVKFLWIKHIKPLWRRAAACVCVCVYVCVVLKLSACHKS